MSKKVLVTGGCGYIGSHTVRELQRQNYEVVVFDNLIKGHRASVEDAPVIVGDLLYPADIQAVFSEHPDISGVVHFAAYIEVAESMEKPGKYFNNNIQGCVNLMDAMSEAGVDALVFSSTCATYGTPENVPVTENESYKPESTYGASKRMAEQVMEWYDQIKGIRSTPLRYFNASGSSFDGRIGDAYKPSTRIIPALLEYILGQRDRFLINGDDWPTPDGTNIRDYIHVDDLATSHIDALNYLWNGGESMAFNIGTGQGTSNMEIVNMVRELSGLDFEIEIGPRRPGDAVGIWADNTRARQILGWEPRYGLREIIETDWQWHSTHPQGYGD